jgi:hypothetical protein
VAGATFDSSQCFMNALSWPKAGQTLGGNTKMAWNLGRYYTRSRKVGGRVVREYFGTGDMANVAAQMDTFERERRETERAARLAERSELDALDAPVKEMDRMADMLARAALVLSGFRQHHRSEWRKQRGKSQSAT